MAPQDDSGAGAASTALSSPPESILDPKEDIDALFQGTGPENSGIREQLERIDVSKEGTDDTLEEPDPSIEVNMDKKRSHRGPFSKSSASSAKKAKTSKKWDPDFLLEDPASVLAKIDLRALLSKPEAWFALTADEKKEVLAKFPDEQHISNPGTEKACPNISSLRNDDNFRHDVTRFRDAISNGQLDSQWLQEAWVAHERRGIGEFDQFKIEKFESEWGVTLPEELKLQEADSSQQAKATTGKPLIEAPDELSGEQGITNGNAGAKETEGDDTGSKNLAKIAGVAPADKS